MPVCEMLKDNRQIVQVNDDRACVTHFILGVNGVTKLELYEERGLTDWIPYLAVFKGDEIAVRMPASGLTIFYKQNQQGRDDE